MSGSEAKGSSAPAAFHAILKPSAPLSPVPIPDSFVEETQRRIVLEGEVPSPLEPLFGCGFPCRCPNCMPEFRTTVPELRWVTGDHQVACLRQ